MFLFSLLGRRASAVCVHGEFSGRGVWTLVCPFSRVFLPSFLPSLVPSFGGSRPSMWPCNSKSQPKRFVTFMRPSGGWVGGCAPIWGGCTRYLYYYRKGVSCAAHSIWCCDHFGTTYRINIQTGLFVYFQHFWGFVSLEKEKKRKDKKSDWLINYSWTSFGGSFEVSTPTTSPTACCNWHTKCWKLGISDSVLLALLAYYQGKKDILCSRFIIELKGPCIGQVISLEWIHWL